MCVLIGGANHPADAGEKAFRRVDISERENGYCNLSNRVIKTQSEFDTYISGVKRHERWSNKYVFANSLINAKIDFDREALVIIPLVEGSGSNIIKFNKPEVEGDKIICRISRFVPEIGNCMMAYYCGVFVVDQARINEIEVRVEGKEDYTLHINSEN